MMPDNPVYMKQSSVHEREMFIASGQWDLGIAYNCILT